MVQTQWQQTLRRKIGLPVSFSGSLYWSLRCRGPGQFSTDSTWLSVEALPGEAPWDSQFLCSFRTQCLELYWGLCTSSVGGFVGAVAAQIFYRFLCLRLVRSGTVAERATPCAPAPELSLRVLPLRRVIGVNANVFGSQISGKKHSGGSAASDSCPNLATRTH